MADGKRSNGTIIALLMAIVVGMMGFGGWYFMAGPGSQDADITIDMPEVHLGGDR